ncbi:transposase [Vibrio crassostreae]|nr:transposase [Vibrio crassostreae]
MSYILQRTAHSSAIAKTGTSIHTWPILLDHPHVPVTVRNMQSNSILQHLNTKSTRALTKNKKGLNNY